MKYMPPSALEDFMIVKAMKLRSDWETQATTITKKLIEVQSSIRQWDLTELEDEANTLKSKISYNRQQLGTTISQVEKMDASRGLFSDRPAKACPTKLPTFGGEEHEDLLTFKDKFNLAAENNKISKTDQLEKLREVLTGNALNHLPVDGIKDIDVAWEYLRQAFGNPHTCLNHRLAKVTAMPGLTDNLQKQDPAYAAEWYLKMENAVDAIIRLGSRNQSLEYVAFNDKTIYHIIAKLPYLLEREAYRFICVRIQYPAQDRPDIQFAAKEAAGVMQAPTVGGWQALKRIGRFLIGAPRLVEEYKRQAERKVVEVYTDSTFAGRLLSRKALRFAAR